MPGNVTDCTQAGQLLAGIAAQNVLADKGYDTGAIVELIEKSGAGAVIPPKANRISGKGV